MKKSDHEEKVRGRYREPEGIKGQVIPGPDSPGSPFLLFETEDGKQYRIENVYRGQILRVEDDSIFRPQNSVPFPSAEIRIEAEFIVTNYMINENPPAKKEYDFEAEVVEETPEIEGGGPYLTSGPGWPD